MKNNNVNALRMLGVAAVNQANSGHPGIVLGAAPIVYVLFNKIMKHNPHNPQWFDRDRFILSAGHGSALLYAALHLAGYQISINDLKQFRQLHSKTPGHPESHLTEGVEVTTGPLGQGVAMGVGFAVAEAHLASIHNQATSLLIDHYTYVLCGDGDLQEGVSYEAISFAGRQCLNKLILIHDSNDIQLDTRVDAVQSEDLHLRFQAAGWATFKVEDGEDLQALEQTILAAKHADKPAYVEVKTIIGLGATKQGTTSVHGAPLGADLATVKAYFEWNNPDFVIPDAVYAHWREHCVVRNQTVEAQWNKHLANVSPSVKKAFNACIERKVKFDFEALLTKAPTNPEATRVSSGHIFDHINNHVPLLIGGSADLVGSTKIQGADGVFDIKHRSGRHILYGVREFAMGAINNGIYKHGGLIPFASGFFVFADYMKPAIRLSSIMAAQALYIFTHDSIAVGEDGPTHQPIEQLAMLRSIPHHVLFRPADYAETLAAYKIMLEDLTHSPSSLILTRQDLVQLPHDDVFAQVRKGGYIIRDVSNPQITLIASGSEVSLALEVAQQLTAANHPTRVVSMPSTNLFDQQPVAYQHQVLDPTTWRISLEMGTTYGWSKYTGDNGLNFGIDQFGASGPAPAVIKHYGFTSEQIFNTILKSMKK